MLIHGGRKELFVLGEDVVVGLWRGGVCGMLRVYLCEGELLKIGGRFLGLCDEQSHRLVILP